MGVRGERMTNEKGEPLFSLVLASQGDEGREGRGKGVHENIGKSMV